jgi:hypothetical protein
VVPRLASRVERIGALAGAGSDLAALRADPREGPAARILSSSRNATESRGRGNTRWLSRSAPFGPRQSDAPPRAPNKGHAGSAQVRLGLEGLDRLPADAQDHHRDDQTDERVTELEPDGDYGCAGDHCETDEPIDADVVAVGDQCGAAEP